MNLRSDSQIQNEMNFVRVNLCLQCIARNYNIKKPVLWLRSETLIGHPIEFDSYCTVFLLPMS